MNLTSYSVLRSLAVLAVLASGLNAQQPRLAQIDKDLVPLDTYGTYSIAVGDVDRDGDPDVILGRSGNDMLLLNQGGGRFVASSPQLPASTVGLSASIAIGDVDADGDLDLVIGTNRGKDLLLLGDGKGGFTDGTQGRLDVDGGATTHVALADLDGDKDLDLMIGSQWSNGNMICWNDGKGNFTRATQALPQFTTNVVPRDVDRDGDVDLLILAGGGLVLWDNNGKGTFTDVSAARLPNPPPAGIVRMAVDDVEADGDPDIVLGRHLQGNLLLQNDGKGRFQDVTAGRMPQLTDNTAALLLVDLTGDRRPELLQANTEYFGVGGTDRIFANDGRGTFTEASKSLEFRDLGVQVTALAAADFDGDGDQDVFATGQWMSARLLLNQNRGRLRVVNQPYLVEAEDTTDAMAVGDIDGDGDVDLITGGLPRDKVWINDGRGRFVEEGLQRLPLVNYQVYAMVLGDIDGDGDLDLVQSGNHLYLNNGKGHFIDASSRIPQDPYVTRDIAMADVDGDGDDDLILGKQQAQNRLYLNDGKGNFTDVTSTHIPKDADYTASLATGDIDGDGDIDIVVGNVYLPPNYSGLNKIYLNDGKGHFTDASPNLPGRPAITRDLALADFDGDGDLDLTTVNAYVNYSTMRDGLYLNDGKGHFKDATSQLPYLLECTWALAVGDLDGDGDLDIVHGNDIDPFNRGGQSLQNRVLINDGKANFKEQTSVWLPAVDDYTHVIRLADVDGDRDLDIFFGNNSSAAGGFPGASRNRIYFNMTQHTIVPGLVRAGATYTMRIVHWRDAQSLARLFLAIPVVGLKDARIGVPPFGVLGVDPTLAIFGAALAVPAPAKSVDLKLPLPAISALRGLVLYGQALVVDPTRPVAEWRLTNPVADRIF